MSDVVSFPERTPEDINPKRPPGPCMNNGRLGRTLLRQVRTDRPYEEVAEEIDAWSLELTAPVDTIETFYTPLSYCLECDHRATCERFCPTVLTANDLWSEGDGEPAEVRDISERRRGDE
jgi:hypothetical protein